MAFRIALPGLGLGKRDKAAAAEPEAPHLHEAGRIGPAPMNPTGPIIAGLVTIAITFGGFGVWAALAPLDSAVVAQGVVVVESNRRDVQHLDGGIIAEILVRDGAVVNSGDVLIRLDPTRAHASLAIVRGQLDATRALQARLRAEQSGASQVEFPADLVARAHDPAINDLLRGQEEIFKARRNSINGQTEILRQRIGQFQQQIGGLRAQEQSRDRQIRLIGEELRGTRDLAEKGYAPRTKVLALERETARLEGDRGEHLAALARTQQSIGEAELQILQLTRTFREEVAKSLQEAQNQILELQERETAALDVVRRLEIRAPADGTVVGLAVTTVGAVIAPGRTILQVVPVRDTLLVEAQLQTTDVENVVVGQRGIINFTALQQRTLPNLTGTVLSVSADRLVDERTGTPYFKARLLIDEESLEKIGDRRLVPGMPADVMIATGERTALQYLIDPLSQIVDYAMRER